MFCLQVISQILKSLIIISALFVSIISLCVQFFLFLYYFNCIVLNVKPITYKLTIYQPSLDQVTLIVNRSRTKQCPTCTGNCCYPVHYLRQRDKACHCGPRLCNSGLYKLLNICITCVHQKCIRFTSKLFPHVWVAVYYVKTYCYGKTYCLNKQ